MITSALMSVEVHTFDSLAARYSRDSVATNEKVETIIHVTSFSRQFTSVALKNNTVNYKQKIKIIVVFVGHFTRHFNLTFKLSIVGHTNLIFEVCVVRYSPVPVKLYISLSHFRIETS